MNERPSSDVYMAMRINAAQESQKATRLAIFTTLILFMAFAIAIWNSYLSWGKLATIDEANKAIADVRKGGHGSQLSAGQGVGKPTSAGSEGSADPLQSSYDAEWMKSRFINFSFLGITVDAYDAVPLGSGTMLVLALWFYLASRRENFAIGSLLRDTVDEAGETRRAILFGVASYSMFKNIDDLTAGPIATLNATSPKRRDSNLLSKVISRLVCFLPALCTTLIIVADYSACLQSAVPFRPEGADILTWSTWLTKHGMWGLALGWYVIGGIMCASTWYICSMSWSFVSSTQIVLMDYGQKMSSSEEARPASDLKEASATMVATR